MPDISEGLSVGGTPATGDAFAAALAGKFGPAGDPIDGTVVETPTAPATAEPVVVPARDPESGKFVPNEAKPAETPVVEALADTSTGDPAVDAYLAKYNGDEKAALKAAVEAQSVIGRQGTTLTQTREELARLQGIVETLQHATPAGPVLSTEQVEERAVELSNGQGYFGAATQLANESLPPALGGVNDSRTYDALLRNWAIEDPISAQRFDLDFQLWKRDQNTPAPAQDARLGAVLESAEVSGIAAVISAVATEKGDAWAAIEPHMNAALEQVPPAVLALVASSDPAEVLAGTRLIADRAQIIALTAAPASAAALQAAADAAVARKAAGSQVATGSLRPAEVLAGSPASKAEAIAKFKQELVAADTQSIADGLTFGK